MKLTVSWLHTNGAFTLTEKVADTETDEKWLTYDCVEVFILHRDRHEYRFRLGSVQLYRSQSLFWYRYQSRSLSV